MNTWILVLLIQSNLATVPDFQSWGECDVTGKKFILATVDEARLTARSLRPRYYCVERIEAK